MIRASQVTKRFGRFTALDGVSFEIAEGQSVALWGPNGAGKTTLLRCLLGVVPFKGAIALGGFDVLARGREARRLCGFVPQELSFHDNLDVWETVDFYARLRKTTASSLEPVLETLQLTGALDKQVRALSGGMKQRLALAIALLGDPPVLMLDEPTANLDLQSRDTFLHELSVLKKAGKTLVFSSHHLDEVSTLADRILLIEGGRLKSDAAPDRLDDLIGRHSVLWLSVDDARMDEAVAVLQRAGWQAGRNGAGIRVRVGHGANAEPVAVLVRAGIPVRHIEPGRVADREAKP